MLNRDFVPEFLRNILSCDFLSFFRHELLQEIIDGDVSSSNTAENFVTLLHFDVDSFLAKLVNTFRFSQEHDSHLFALWVLIDEIAKKLIDLIIFVSDINTLTFF